MDWTIGLFEPRNLEAGRQYFIRVLGPPGDAPSLDTRLVAERLPNDCPGDPHIITCINTNLIDDIDPEGETLVQGDPMFTVPGCREWRAESDVSFACIPPVGGMHVFDDGLFDLRFFDEAGFDPTEKRFDRADVLQ